ncbi:MAG TPA: cyclopropane fatty acyl phospholipid synthase [Povalibacter sp.]|uniref:cyclopropane fatty acyl phospholipid synthase n=1 Tax=Povalibacter sp. TaxID=1962978 RepID=UPI002BEF01F3|nr:cyclopropane fatty acyl phospholipid synthase [Povalibacter sp.]HMN47273.1 cyclopropane fatty acyl phospholipid synthase [Povalibacter sp.]
MTSYRDAVESLLNGTDVAIDGDHPWDIRVRDPGFFRRVLAQGSLGVGEAYMDGQWDCERLDEMLFRVFRAQAEKHLPTLRQFWAALVATVMNPQTPRRSFKVGQKHYDIGDDLYSRMLDPRMIYSCAYWKDAQTLEQAQEAKLDLVCRKLRLEKGMSVLDIGCGWGGAAQFAAERYGVNVTGVTVSKNQAAAATERCKGLPVKILLQDYRALTGRFDRIYSLGMFEHVGFRNYRTYFSTAEHLLERDGLFLLHTIGSNTTQEANDPWVERYIFPNSMLPSIVQIARAAESHFITEDWHSFGPYYDRTLVAWFDRFRIAWPELAEKYGERFKRMWEFWLLSSAAAFRARRIQLWQVLFSPQGVAGGLPEVR